MLDDAHRKASAAALLHEVRSAPLCLKPLSLRVHQAHDWRAPDATQLLVRAHLWPLTRETYAVHDARGQRPFQVRHRCFSDVSELCGFDDNNNDSSAAAVIFSLQLQSPNVFHVFAGAKARDKDKDKGEPQMAFEVERVEVSDACDWVSVRTSVPASPGMVIRTLVVAHVSFARRVGAVFAGSATDGSRRCIAKVGDAPNGKGKGGGLVLRIAPQVDRAFVLALVVVASEMAHMSPIAAHTTAGSWRAIE